MSQNGHNGQNGNGHVEAGDLGGFALERRDLGNLERLIKSDRWKMPDELSEELPARLRQKAMGMPDPDTGELPSERHQLIAARILAGLEGQNQADEHLAVRLSTGTLNQGDITVHIVQEDRKRLEADDE